MRYTLDSDGKKNVTLIHGDGVGLEVVHAARQVVDAAGVKIAWHECEAGAASFRRGIPSGVPAETIESIRRNRVALKGPLETPVGFGEKSANVTLRKLFETYANVRPIREFAGVKTPYSGRGIDLVIVRENVEDLYAGIEHMQTPNVAQCLKIMSRQGCEKIVRLAFELAVAEGRKKVHCATKANIMKLTEGMLKRTFEAIAKEYPAITAEHIIVDNCAHQLVRFPESFEVIVTSNMNGDILSDLTSGLVGGLGFAPGANLGRDVAIFEAVHGSAPKYAMRNVINPTAVILSAVMMLRHLDEFEAARRIENAVRFTLEDNRHTRDVEAHTAISTSEFTSLIIDNFDRMPSEVDMREHRPLRLETLPIPGHFKPQTRRSVGVDVFVESSLPVTDIAPVLEALATPLGIKLKMISNRGTKVYPDNGGITDCVDHWRCRFVVDATSALDEERTLALVSAVGKKFTWMHLEKLSEIDGVASYAKAQGED